IALAFQIRGTVELHQGPSEHLAHLELASVGDRETLGFIGRELVWVAASLGLNEQELGALYRVLGGTEYTLESFKAPSLQTSIDAMVFILNWVPRVLNPFALMRKENQLSRIHMHFLSYHVVCTTSRLSKQRWTEQGTRRSVQTGALTATRKACGNAETGEFPDVEQVDLQWDTLLAATKYKLTWKKPWIDVRPTPGIFCSVYPVLVCNSPLRTVGLGDAISSSGLFAQIQSKD
ncbi:MAG: ADP-dependent glucokinase/phosphofructokinase, partial [Cyanobacteria bacterium]|nr:ADP-dependent glucokinase/phosphofructokinase [Cyanobacteriota bacterium]